MRRYVCIGCGGFVGALLRFLLSHLDMAASSVFPFRTLLANALGTFLLSSIMSVTAGLWHVDDDIRLALTVGLCGSLTTFSTFCKETSNLLLLGSYGIAALYLVVSVLSGLAIAFLSMGLGNIVSRPVGEKKR